MKLSVTRPIVLALAAFLPAASTLAAQPPVEPNQFPQLHALIKPTAAETKWTQIPWMTSLWDARKRAAAEGKPLLLWEMDGHPMGCV